MFPFANVISKSIWRLLIWIMRRPMIKRMRRQAPNLLPPKMREAAWESIKAQDRWALKYGKTVLSISVNVFLVILVLFGSYVLLDAMSANGQLGSRD